MTSNATILQEGWLNMRTAKGGWKRRYFFLCSNGILTYHRKKSCSQPRGGLFLNSDFYVADSCFRNGFQVSNLDRVFYLQAESLKARIAWMVKLAEVIAALDDSSSAQPRKEGGWTLIQSIYDTLSRRDSKNDQWHENAEEFAKERLKRESARWDEKCSVIANQELQETSQPRQARRLSVKSVPFWEVKARKKTMQAKAEDSAAAELAQTTVALAAAEAKLAVELAAELIAGALRPMTISDAPDSRLQLEQTTEHEPTYHEHYHEHGLQDEVLWGLAHNEMIAVSQDDSEDDDDEFADVAHMCSTSEAEVTATGGTAMPVKEDCSAVGVSEDGITHDRPWLCAHAALEWVDDEIQKLLSVIEQYGVLDESGQCVITFGELFARYARISDTLVGILMRARKRCLVVFDAAMLFKGVHDHVNITLLSLRSPRNSHVEPASAC